MTWPHRDQLAFPNPHPGAPSVPLDLSSFSELLRRQAPQLLPVAASGPESAPVPAASAALPHGTTIVALKYPGGVVIAGDRRSTQGNMIANRDVQKVYITDDYTATGIAGTAAIAVEFARRSLPSDLRPSFEETEEVCKVGLSQWTRSDVAA